MASEGRAMGILQRSSSLIQLLAERGPLSTAEVAEEIGMPRPSVYRLADALTQTRLVESTSDGKLRVSLRWLKLSDAARSGMREWSHARPLLDGLASRTGQTIYLSVPQADRAICIDWSPGRALSVLALKPGRTLPLYAGAAGRVTLAYRPEPLEDYLRAAPFPPLTDHTLVTARELRADVEAIRSRGYSVSDEDVTLGIGALGAPLISRDGMFLGALSLAGLAEDLRVRRAELSADLLACADELSASTDYVRGCRRMSRVSLPGSAKGLAGLPMVGSVVDSPVEGTALPASAGETSAGSRMIVVPIPRRCWIQASASRPRDRHGRSLNPARCTNCPLCDNISHSRWTKGLQLQVQIMSRATLAGRRFQW